MTSRFTRDPDVTWLVEYNEGVLGISDPEGTPCGDFPATRKGSRDAFEYAVGQGATHVRFAFDLKLIEH